MENPFFLAFWIIVLTFFSTHFIHSALVRRTAIKEKERQEQLLKFEEERGLRLMKELENAQSDFAKEKIIRDELHMQKPGETILQLPPSPTP